MPTYQITFAGGGRLNRSPMTIHCVDDDQALSWASGFLEFHLGAEIREGARKVGWVTTSGNREGASFIRAHG